MSYNHEEYALQAAVEGNGYHKSKGLQWLDLCPHLGTSEKTLLRVLLSLTRQDNPRRKIAPEDLRHMVYAGPVALGEAPKYASASGLRRMLRNLATLGQITTPEDEPLTFSSGRSAQDRAVTMQIWRYPRHECASRNAFDALARVRGERPRFAMAGPDMAPLWEHLPADNSTPSDQAGQKDDQAGQKDDQAGQKDDQAGQKDDQCSSSDQEKGDPPSTGPSTVPTTPPSPLVPPVSEGMAPDPDLAGREDENSTDTNGQGDTTEGSANSAASESQQDPSDQETHLERAQALVVDSVRRWPKSHKAPSVRDAHRLSERVAAELAAGGDEDVILHELTRDLKEAGSAVRVILGARTKTPGWGRSSDPRPDHSRYEIPASAPWCGTCDEHTRMVQVDDPHTGKRTPGRCRAPVQDTAGQTVACNPNSTPLVNDDDQGESLPDLSAEEFTAMTELSLENPGASTQELLLQARAKVAQGAEEVHAGRKRR